MTQKEKAKELVMKFQHIVTSWDCYNDEPLELEYMMVDMKKCALICLDDKIKFIIELQISDLMKYDLIEHRISAK